MKYFMIDPPEGWRYGFPKAIMEEDYKLITNFGAWCVERGYPQSEVDYLGKAFYVGVSGPIECVDEGSKPARKEDVETPAESKSPQRDFTPEQVKAYIEHPYECPECESGDLDYGNPVQDPFGNIIGVEVTCQNCQCKWEEIREVTTIIKLNKN